MVSYRYNHIHLNTQDMPKAIKFYEQMFGAKVIHRGQPRRGRSTTVLDINGMRLLVSDKLYPLDAPPLPGCSAPHMGLEHFGLGTNNFEEAVSDLRANGAEFLMEPHEHSPGFKIAYIRAPDDVRIEIHEAK